MKISFWGVRGFIPVPGPDSLYYGGNTICVGVESDNGSLVALDAGTGLSVWGRTLLGTDLGKGKGQFLLFITHPHYEHIQGFSFFIPALIPGNHIEIYGSSQCERTMEDILESQMTPIFSPMQTLKNFGSVMDFNLLSVSDPIRIDDIKIEIINMPHKVNSSLGIKFTDSSGSFVYAPDVLYEKNIDKYPEIIDFISGTDLLIHDTTSSKHYGQIFSPDLSNDGKDAVILAGYSKVKKVSLIHYHHDYDDKKLEKMVDATRKFALKQGFTDMEIDLAQEGKTILL